MSIAQLDLIFPFILLLYGASVSLVTHSEFFLRLAESRLPHFYQQQLRRHRPLALICLVLGSVWSAQNVWYLNL